MDGRSRLHGAFLIAVSRIRPDPTQPRKKQDAAAAHELAESVRRYGILQPLSVRYLVEDDIYQIISGARRFQAALDAGLSDVPCWVQEPRDEEVFLRQIVENWQRSDLHPYDLADALAYLRDTKGMSNRDLARETGKSEGEISKLLALLKLNPASQREARADETGTLTKRHLYAIAKLPAAEQERMVHAVKQQHLTAIDTERTVRDIQSKETTPHRRGAPVTVKRFHTASATVTLTFRRRTVSSTDIREALDDARAQADADAGAAAPS